MNGNQKILRLNHKTLAWLIAAIELLFIAAGTYFGFLATSMNSAPTGWQYWLGGLIYSLPIIAFLMIGMLIVFRLPHNHYGWVLIAFSFSFGGWRYFFDSLGGYLYAQGASPQAVGFTAFLTSIGWITGFLLLIFILLLFPTGQYFSRFWRVVGRLALSLTIIFIPLSLFRSGKLAFIAQIENPYGLSGVSGEIVNFLFFGSFAIFALCLFSSVISVVIRFFKSRGVERQQIKWFAFAAFLFALQLLLDNFTGLPQPWESLKETLGLLVLPLGIGIAILRYHLWDIDVIIRKTLVYGALTLTLALVYFGSVILLQSLVTVIGGQQSAVVTVISTLIIAALFTPLRRRIQSDIDRRFYRKKYDAEKTLAAFRENLRQAVDLDELSDRLLTVIEETMQPEHTSLWLQKTKK